MREANMWRRLKKALEVKGSHIMRVENPALPGTPDVNYCFEGFHLSDPPAEGWIELKQLPKWPVRETTKVRIDHYTPEQKLWALLRTAAGGNTYLMLKVGRSEWLLFSGYLAAKRIGRLTKEEMINWSIKYWPKGLDDDELRGILFHGKINT